MSIPFLEKYFVLNLGFFAWLYYSFVYLKLGDYVAAASYNTILFGVFLGANYAFDVWGPKANLYALVLHIFSWFMQVSVGTFTSLDRWRTGTGNFGNF